MEIKSFNMNLTRFLDEISLTLALSVVNLLELFKIK